MSGVIRCRWPLPFDDAVCVEIVPRVSSLRYYGNTCSNRCPFFPTGVGRAGSNSKKQSGADTEWGRGVGRYYGVQITVVEDDGRPARFIWDGRVYGVRRIIDHWITLRMDWVPARENRVPERKHWRVEAGAAGPLGVYELRNEVRTGEWLLARV